MLSTVAFAAALAVAPAVEGRKFGSFSERFGVPGPAPNGGFSTSGPKTVVSTAKCSAVAVTKNFSASKDAHVYAGALLDPTAGVAMLTMHLACSAEPSGRLGRDACLSLSLLPGTGSVRVSFAHEGGLRLAVAEAWKYACSLDAKFDDWYWAHIYKNMIDVYGEKEFGFAFAKAVAATAAQCDTDGNAYGCAASFAYSAAWATAAASAHAEAWAEAVQKCNCNGKEQITAANSDAYATESKYFKAQVEAVAESSACGYYGYDDAPDADAQTCVQNIYFTSIAKVRKSPFCVLPLRNP